MAITKEQIIDRLKNVIDPQQGRDIVTAEVVKHIAVCDGLVSVKLALPAGGPMRAQLKHEVEAAVRGLGDEIGQVTVEFVSPPPPQAATGGPSAQQTARQTNPLPDVRHVVAIGAGKGGVGKSTIAVNLAVGLARDGLKVGLLDGDIYGPSAPTLLGLADVQITGTSERLHPMQVHGIKAMTIGKLVDPEKALIWRGPMAHGAFRQLALQTDWGELDYLVVDLPPGTGDVPLTLAQMLPLSGAIIVCTPQKVAQDDAVRAVRMFEQLDVPVLGVVENMSYFVGDDGKEYDIFGRGGAKRMAERLELPLLGMIPINTAVRVNGDAGDPRKNFDGGGQLATELEAMCRNVVKVVQQRAGSRPTLSVR